MLTVLDGKRRYLARKNGMYHIGDFAVLKELKEGRAKLGTREVYVLRSNLYDYISTLKRKAQIIALKDAAYIIARCGIRSGWRVVEGGAGSGAMSLALLYYTYPDGKVYTYELRDDFAAIAKKNVENAGLQANWILKKGDIRKDVEERDVDAFILDIPEPWEAVDMAKKALRQSGCIMAYIPTYNQLERVYRKMKSVGFVDLEATEIIKRDILVGEMGTRPDNVEVAHTGFMVFGRKL